MLYELFAMLESPESYRAIWRDGELTIERIPVEDDRSDLGARDIKTSIEPRTGSSEAPTYAAA